MNRSELSTVEHLLVNRIEVMGDRCSACGKEFTSNPAGAHVLSATVEPHHGTYIFCESCGDSIMNHVLTDAVRERYAWDWTVPLRGIISESDATNIRDSAPVATAERLSGSSKTYPSERAAIIAFLGRLRAGEANGAEAFAGWAAVCTTDSIKMGIRMIAEREACHARVFARRLQELGCQNHDTAEAGQGFKRCLADPEISDNEKLSRLANGFASKEAIKPVYDFAALIRDDIQTKDALLLFAEDELSTISWVRKTARALLSSKPLAELQHRVRV